MTTTMDYQTISKQITDDKQFQNEVFNAMISRIPKFKNEQQKEKFINLLKQKVSKRNPPRHLTDNEINSVVEYSIGTSPAVIDKIAQDNKRQVKDFVRNQLKNRKMVVSEKNMEQLKKEVRKRYFTSLVQAGESVGVDVAMSFGQPLTQMNLDTFHQAGASSGLSSGIKALEELFNVSKEKKKNITTVHFNDKNLTFEEVIMEGQSLKCISVQSLAESIDILDAKTTEDVWWYDNYKQLFDNSDNIFDTLTRDREFMRIKLNIDKCYSNSISIYEIVNVITRSIDDDHIYCVSSPLSIGVIDIYTTVTEPEILIQYEKKFPKLNEESVDSSGTTERELRLLFLNSILKKSLSELIVRGINHIENIFPVSEDVINLLKSQKHETKVGWWYINLDYYKFKYFGIPLTKVKVLIEESSLKLIKNDTINNGKLSKNPYIVVQCKTDPINIMRDKFSESQTIVKDEIKRINNNENERDFILPNFPFIYRAAKYNYANIEGKNITRRLLKNKKLDKKFTMPNNPNEILDIFGIETARFYMVREYIKLIESSGSYITPVHINLLVDYQTTMGFLTAISSYGSSKQGVTTLTAAAFQDPVGKFKNAAVAGKKNKITSLSSCIMTGKRFFNGTGFSTVNIEYDSIIKPESRPKVSTIKPNFCKQNYVIDTDTTEDKVTYIPEETPIKTPNKFMNLNKKRQNKPVPLPHPLPYPLPYPSNPHIDPYHQENQKRAEYNKQNPHSPVYTPGSPVYPSSFKDTVPLEQWIDEYAENLYNRYKDDYTNMMKSRSSNYEIIENEGAGNCFFASLRDGFVDTRYSSVTVEDMRLELSKRATEEVFRNLKDIESQLPDDYDFIKNISNLEEFRKYILKPSYWADEWAISIIEKIYNVKVIILNNDTKSVECGYDGYGADFKPENYIVMEYTVNPRHYRVVGVNNDKSLNFDKIPIELKIEIIKKCMEKDAGPYNNIEDFRNMKVEMNNTLTNLEQVEPLDRLSDLLDDLTFSESESPKSVGGDQQRTFADTKNSSKSSDGWDPDDWDIPEAPDNDREWKLQDLKL